MSCKSKINVINISSDDIKIEEGKESVSSGKIAVLALEKAAQDISTGAIDVIVTAPISKSVCQKAGFDFPGHTETKPGGRSNLPLLLPTFFFDPSTKYF